MSRIKPRRSTPRRRLAPRWTLSDWDAANLALQRRSGGRCEHCGAQLQGRVERHHRQRREVGGDRLANVVYLRPECHQWITEHPEEATRQGWIVSSYHPDPAAAPMLHGGIDWVLLDDDGTTQRAQGSPPP